MTEVLSQMARRQEELLALRPVDEHREVWSEPPRRCLVGGDRRDGCRANHMQVEVKTFNGERSDWEGYLIKFELAADWNR